MKRLIILVTMFLCAIGTFAQTYSDDKPIVAVDYFTASTMWARQYAVRLRDLVMGSYSKSNRIDIIDLERADGSAAVEQYVLYGSIDKMRCDGSRDRSGDKSYKASINYTLKLVDARTKKLLVQRSYLSEWSHKTYDEAINRALEFTSDQLKAFLEASFPLQGRILEMVEADKTGTKAAKVYIDLGTAEGMTKGQKMDVMMAVNIAGETTMKIVGTLTAKSVLSENRTLCKVNDGGDVIMNGLKNGKKIIVRTRMAHSFLSNY
jgi:hypothetical protein